MSKKPESNPGALVTSSPKALAIANRQLHIAGQALARIGQERYIEFFATHPEASRAFVRAVSLYCACNETLIERYAELWDWKWLSSNETLPWSEKLIKCFAEKWDWTWLSHNKTLPWSDELIERYAELWDWKSLSRNKALPWTEALIERYAERWDWESLSRHSALPWSEELIERYAARWDWRELSSNKALPWSWRLIERFTRWTWGYVIGNQALPWSEKLIEKFAEHGACKWLRRFLSKSFPLFGIEYWHWQISSAAQESDNNRHLGGCDSAGCRIRHPPQCSQ